MKTPSVSFLLFVLVGVTAGQVQFQTGVYSLTGRVSYNSATEESQWSTSSYETITLSPTYNYFIFEGFELSIGPTFAHFTQEFRSAGSPTTSSSKGTTLAIALGLRYYVASESVAPFVGVGGRVYWSRYWNETFDSRYSIPQREYFGEIGAAIFVTQHFAIEPTLQFGGATLTQQTQKNMSVFLGFKYFVY